MTVAWKNDINNAVCHKDYKAVSIISGTGAVFCTPVVVVHCNGNDSTKIY
jgi:hypothetical protein